MMQSETKSLQMQEMKSGSVMKKSGSLLERLPKVLLVTIAMSFLGDAYIMTTCKDIFLAIAPRVWLTMKTFRIFPGQLRHCKKLFLSDLPLQIPDWVTHLRFHHLFEQRIRQNDLPAGLKHLTLSRWYNHPINPGVLPAGLTSLVFGAAFDQPINPGVLPAGLTSLVVGY